jgi:hypothetical protein
MSKKALQIQWLVDHYYRQEPHKNTVMLSPSDAAMELAFEQHFALETPIGDRLWTSRIKAAAEQCGLTGVRFYYGAGDPHPWGKRSEMVYS